MLTISDHLVIIYGNDNKIYIGQNPSLKEEVDGQLGKIPCVSVYGDSFKLENAVEVRRFDQVVQGGGIASMQKAAFIVPFMKIVPEITIPGTHAIVVVRAFDPYWFDEMLEMIKSLENDEKNIQAALQQKHSKISAPNTQEVSTIANMNNPKGGPVAPHSLPLNWRKN